MPTVFKYLLSVLVLVGGLSFSLLKGRATNDGAELRLAHSLATEHAVHKALVYFQHKVSDLSAGQVKVTIYPSGQLGSERDMIELLQIGSLAMTKVSTGPLEAFEPAMKVFSFPYVFSSNEHYWRVLNSDVGKRLLSAAERVGLKGLAYFDAGSRSFYSCAKGIYSPDDLKGLKIRSMKSQSAVNMLNAMGASATPIAFGELYSALQQGVVDGAENNAITFYKSKHYEVCKHYTLDQHNAIPDIILISKKVWDGLNMQQRDWIEKAMADTVVYQRQLWKSETQLALDAIAKAGVNIIRPDKSLFVEKVAPYKQQFAGTKIGMLLNEIAELDK